MLIGVFAALGTVLGVTGGLTMHLCTADGKVFVRAGFTAASLWVLSIAARLVFILWTEHSAGPTLYRFSTQHQITSMQVWVSALILMVLAEMVTRIATILLRAALAKRSALAALAPAAS